MEAKNTSDGRGTNRSYLEFGGTVDVQNTCSVIRIHDPDLKIDYFITFNYGDFADVCKRFHRIMI